MRAPAGTLIPFHGSADDPLTGAAKKNSGRDDDEAAGQHAQAEAEAGLE